jgi:hypothetical protein
MQVVALAAINALVSVGVGAISKAIVGKPSVPSVSNVTAWTPSNSELMAQQPDPGGPHPGIFGHRRVGGKVVFSGIVGGKTYLVIEIAGAPVNAINAVYVNNSPVTISGGDVQDSPWKSGANASMNIVTYDGTQTTVDSVMTAAFPGWTADYTGKQIAYARIRIDPTIVAASVYKGGVPDFTFDVSGFKCYDPRDGTQDINTPSTWKFSGNAAIINANYLIHVLGHNLSTSRVDWTSVGTAADICDQAVTLKNGGTEARYSAAVIWQTNERHETVLDRIGQAHAGGAYFIGKKYLIRSGAWTASSASITTDNYASEGISFSDTPPLSQICNGVRGTFTSPLQNYETRDFPAYQDSTALSADGSAYWLDLQLDAVTSPTQAQRLAKIAYNKARYGYQASVGLQFTCFEITSEDVIDITDSLAGFSATTFRVIEDRLSGDFVCQLTLQYEASTFYDWTAGTDEQDFTTVAAVTGEGGAVGGPGHIVYDSNVGTPGAGNVLAELTPPGSGNAVSMTWRYAVITTATGVVVSTSGPVVVSAAQQVVTANTGLPPTFASGNTARFESWCTDASGSVSATNTNGGIVNTDVDGKTAASTTLYFLPTPAAPRLLSIFNGVASILGVTPGGSRTTHLELWENSTNNSGTASVVTAVAVGSTTWTRTAAIGTVKWYWLKSKNVTDSKVSGFSNPILVVF